MKKNVGVERNQEMQRYRSSVYQKKFDQSVLLKSFLYDI